MTVTVIEDEKTERKRTTRLNIRLQVAMMENLEKLSVEMGVAASTLGAIAVAEYVNTKVRQDKLLELTAQLSAEHAGKAAENVFEKVLGGECVIEELEKMASIGEPVEAED